MSMKTLAARIQFLGDDQIARMNKQKLESFHWALKNSYNSRMIKYKNAAWPCLINVETGGLKADYDKKMVSVDFKSGLEAGEVFEVLDDGSHWMIYLPIITETAYLRSEIIRCRYKLVINGIDYWVYFQGPSETDLRWVFKNNINANQLNLSGTIYIKNDENTKAFFKRFTRIKIDGHTWEIQVTDSISVPGIIELEVQEYYDNSIEELPEIIQEDDSELRTFISGETEVKQNTIIGYAVDDLKYRPEAKWTVENNPRVKLQETMENGRICKVKVFPGAVRTFDVVYDGKFRKTVSVKWEKPIIQGPEEVYPYETHTYWMKGEDRKVKFRIQDDTAKIISANDDSCQVEITSGKKGCFTIECKLEDGSIVSLPVKIKSL